MYLEELEQLVRDEGIIDPTYAFYQLKTWDKGGLITVEKHESYYIIYTVVHELNNKKCLAELFFYIPKAKRGNIRVVLDGLKRFEQVAKENDCEVLKVGANYGLKSDKFVKLLTRKGFVPDTMVKEI